MERIINFLKYRSIALVLSLALFMIFVVTTYLNDGLKWGIDFVGGVKIVAKFDKSIDITEIRNVLGKEKIDALVQQIGKEEQNEYIIAAKMVESEVSTERSFEIIRNTLNASFHQVEYLSVENVGPAIGYYLKKSAIQLFLIALVLITLYLSFRFEFKYSVGAISALVHDIVLSVTFCGMMGLEINIPIIAALLFTFGYSVNDTIVVFDRIRENVEIKSKQTFIEVINKSISQSISRTLLTSLTTLFAVFALYLLGGDVLNNFALVLLFGIVVGTYSSIYIASSMVLGWEKFFAK